MSKRRVYDHDAEFGEEFYLLPFGRPTILKAVPNISTKNALLQIENQRNQMKIEVPVRKKRNLLFTQLFLIEF